MSTRAATLWPPFQQFPIRGIVVLALLLNAGAVRARERLLVHPAATVGSYDRVGGTSPSIRAEMAAVRTLGRMPAPSPRDIGGALAGPAVPRALAVVAAQDPREPLIRDRFPALGDDNTFIPPDTMGAVGPSHVMTMLNTEVRIESKQGDVLATVSLSAFWTAGTGLHGGPFDPHVVYDVISGRWIATVFADGKSSFSKVWLGISASADPTGAWTFYEFPGDPTGVTWVDSPGLGVNNTWIAITANMYTVATTPTLVGPKMWVIDKAGALAGGSLTVNVFPARFDVSADAYGFSLKPALTYSPTEPTLYIVDNGGFVSGDVNLIRLSRITGTGTAPTWSVVPGSYFPGTGLFPVGNRFDYTSVDAPQAGTGTLVDAGDYRASDAVYRNGRVWFAHSGTLPPGAPTRTAVFWYQLDPAAMPRPILQSGVLDGGPGVHHFYPSIAANSADDALIGFSRSDAATFIEAVTASRLGTDPPGAMTAPAVLKLGEASYVKDFGERVRWGDYSATCVDPADDSTFWTIQEYAAVDVGPGPSDDRWGTWWGVTRCNEGGACSDADACTTSDRCEAGECISGPPVVCAARDSCHVAGTCEPATGACTNPAADDGTLCSDGNACTQVDMCQAGACVGREPVTLDTVVFSLSLAPDVTGCASRADGRLVRRVTKCVKRAERKATAARRKPARASMLVKAARKAMKPAKAALHRPGTASAACLATLGGVVGGILDRLACVR